MLKTEVRRGYIFYAGAGRREEVVLDDALRLNTEEVIRTVRRLLETGERPDVGYHNRCRGCSLEPICLPRERALLRVASLPLREV
jgi:CRISPR-associated exonuclease Cas4